MRIDPCPDCGEHVNIVSDHLPTCLMVGPAQIRQAGPQHLGTCRRCGNTYLLGTSCGDADHLNTQTRSTHQ
jgi:hypothetical protein